jgi:hypothetical protein
MDLRREDISFDILGSLLTSSQLGCLGITGGCRMKQAMIIYSEFYEYHHSCLDDYCSFVYSR